MNGLFNCQDPCLHCSASSSVLRFERLELVRQVVEVVLDALHGPGEVDEILSMPLDVSLSGYDARANSSWDLLVIRVMSIW